MGIKDKATEVLIELGVSMDKKGFAFIVTAMELFEDERYRKGRITDLYSEIARIHNTVSSRVERNIRHVFKTTLLNCDNPLVSKYLDTKNGTNGANLSKLYYRISKELED